MLDENRRFHERYIEAPDQADSPSDDAANVVRPALPPCPIVPRYLASLCDNVIAIILGYVAAKSVSDELPVIQGLLLVGVYLGYFFLSEAIFSATLAKRFAGLCVVDLADGSRLSWLQAAIRTVWRILEVNPLLLGAIPAGLMIACSQSRQRLGDQAAGTSVVELRALKKFRGHP